MRRVGLCCLCGLMSLSVGPVTDVSGPLEETAECLVNVAKATPEVSDVTLGVDASGGWTRPFVEYRADEALSRGRPIRFTAIRDQGSYEFWAFESGLGAPELHVTEAVMQKWETHCQTYANVLFP